MQVEIYCINNIFHFSGVLKQRSEASQNISEFNLTEGNLTYCFSDALNTITCIFFICYIKLSNLLLLLFSRQRKGEAERTDQNISTDIGSNIGEKPAGERQETQESVHSLEQAPA